MINRWKKELHEGGRTIFGFPKRKERETEVLQAALYEQIGRLKFELDWLKKKLLLSVEARRTLLEVCHPQLSVRRQCELVGLNRSSVYYQPACASPENLHLMRLMDESHSRGRFMAAVA